MHIYICWLNSLLHRNYCHRFLLYPGIFLCVGVHFGIHHHLILLFSRLCLLLRVVHFAVRFLRQVGPNIIVLQFGIVWVWLFLTYHRLFGIIVVRFLFYIWCNLPCFLLLRSLSVQERVCYFLLLRSKNSASFAIRHLPFRVFFLLCFCVLIFFYGVLVGSIC